MTQQTIYLKAQFYRSLLFPLLPWQAKERTIRLHLLERQIYEGRKNGNR
jgi:hypothetical protein